MLGFGRKLCATLLVATAALVAANMWIVGLATTPDGDLIRSPGGFMESWPWINALYATMCGYWFARLSAESPAPAARWLRRGFAFVAVACVANLALLDLAGLDLFWIWHFVDGVLVVTFLGQAACEWKAVPRN